MSPTPYTPSPTDAETLPPHFRCDCVPDLGPAHCHRCSRATEHPVQWDDAPCQQMVAEPAYVMLMAAGQDEALRILSDGFDRQQENGIISKADTVNREVLTELAPGAPIMVISPPQVEPTIIPLDEMFAASAASSPLSIASRIGIAPVKPVTPTPPKTRAVLIDAVEHHAFASSHAWRLTNLARKQIHELGLVEQDIIDILDGPHVTTPASNNTATNHYGDGLLMMVDLDGECIISVIERETPIHLGSATGGGKNDTGRTGLSNLSSPGSTSKHKSHSGGSGRRIPSKLREILAMLHEHGFHTELGGKGHHIATHPQHPRSRFTVPSSPSDHRSYPNTLADIKRATGIDISQKKKD